MSSILGSAQPGLVFSGSGSDDLRLSETEQRLFKKFFAPENALLIQKEFISWLRDRLVIDGFELPISQVSGFAQFNAQTAPAIVTPQATTSTSYTNLGTVGPTLGELSDGQYLVVWGATYAQTTGVGDSGYMGIMVNTSEATDADSIFSSGSGAVQYMPGARAHPFTLANDGNNSLTARYRTVGGNSTEWRNRWLVALRFGNP